MGQCLKHRSLAPMDHRCLGRYEGITPIIEMTIGVLHMFDSPAGNACCKIKARRIGIGKECKGVDNLGCALDINWLAAIVILPGTAIWLDKTCLKVIEAPREVLIPGLIPRVDDIPFEAV